MRRGGFKRLESGFYGWGERGGGGGTYHAEGVGAVQGMPTGKWVGGMHIGARLELRVKALGRLKHYAAPHPKPYINPKPRTLNPKP